MDLTRHAGTSSLQNWAFTIQQFQDKKSTCDHVHIFFDKSANSCERRQSPVFAYWWRYTYIWVLPVEIALYGAFVMIEKIASKSWQTKRSRTLAWTTFSGTSNNCKGIANALWIIYVYAQFACFSAKCCTCFCITQVYSAFSSMAIQ